GALRAGDRSRIRLFRSALQSWQHLPRSRPISRGAGLLSGIAPAQPVLCRRAFLSGGDVREDGFVAGSAAALARLPAARAAGRVGRVGEGVFGVVAPTRPSNTGIRSDRASWACVGAYRTDNPDTT